MTQNILNLKNSNTLGLNAYCKTLEIVEKEQISFGQIPMVKNPNKKSKLIVLFLAILELARQGSIEVSQSSFNGTIWILKTGT